MNLAVRPRLRPTRKPAIAQSASSSATTKPSARAASITSRQITHLDHHAVAYRYAVRVPIQLRLGAIIQGVDRCSEAGIGDFEVGHTTLSLFAR